MMTFDVGHAHEDEAIEGLMLQQGLPAQSLNASYHWKIIMNVRIALR